jgi:hypothetical protein
VQFRTRLAHTIVATFIAFTALAAVGLTAPADAAFTIAIRPVFATLGFDVDVKLGGMHLHFAWSAIPAGGSSTK